MEKRQLCSTTQTVALTVTEKDLVETAVVLS
jgi:hypothetical protein